MNHNLPHRIDADEFFSSYETLQEWADNNAELFSDLLLQGCEELAYGTLKRVELLVIESSEGDESRALIFIDLDLVMALNTATVNQDYWVGVEDYVRAARARDALGYIKKKASDAHTSD